MTTKPVKVLFRDGKERLITEAVQDAKGNVTFVSTVGERLPASKVLNYKAS